MLSAPAPPKYVAAMIDLPSALSFAMNKLAGFAW